MDFKSLIKISMLKKLAHPNASKDLNVFLEKLPDNVGKNVLIAAGIAWGAAAALGLITMVKVQELTTLRAELKEAEALTPSVPFISENPVSKAAVEKFAEQFEETYQNVEITQQGSKVMITSGTTRSFGEFRESIAHVYNGGANWRVGLEKLCVGRECDTKHQLAVALNIKQVSVENPNQ